MPIRNRVYHLTITTRSPLHIATGQQLVKDFDFAYDEAGRVAYVVNMDALMPLLEERLARRRQVLVRKVEEFEARPARRQAERERDDLSLEIEQLNRLRREALAGLPLDALLKARLLNFKDHFQAGMVVGEVPLVRYKLAGDLSAADSVSEQIKDARGRPYLPGSSLKGALRTVLAWRHFPEAGLEVGLDALRDRDGKLPADKYADANYEARLFVGGGGGTAANRDLLRTLQVGDSTSIEPGGLMLAPVTIYGGRPPLARLGRQAAGFDVLNVEAVAPDQSVEARVHIEEYPFVAQERRVGELGFAARHEWLLELAAACRERCAALLAAEQAYYRERGLAALERFCASLQHEAAELGPNGFLLPIGWGAGWRSKTLGERLEAEPEEFAAIVQQYRLKRQRSEGFEPGDLFPVTRKLVLNGGQPWRPLGWVRVIWEEQTVGTSA